MPVDNSPAQSAQSLLNGIDYAALIGGPLQAAIKAQAMAANSTWEFIQQVGLNTDKDGNRSAINVTFMYQRDGELVKLIVPILTIVPIPLIIIDEVSIDFTANINASASSTTEDTKSEDIGGELEAEGKIGWGPFSLSARMKASYSSKQSSKATQDSRYSVEYTQVVKVHATQADMPAGLATVLNILSSAATGGSRNGQLTVSPALATVDANNPNALQMIEIRTVDANGLNVKTDVKIALSDLKFKGCFKFFNVLTGQEIPWDTSGEFLMVTTSERGRISLNLGPGDTAVPAPPPLPFFRITATLKGDKEPQEVVLPVRVVAAAVPPSPVGQSLRLTAQQPSISVPGLNAVPVSTTQTWTVLMQGHEGRRQPVRILYDAGSVSVRYGGKQVTSGETLPLDDRGMARLEFEVASGAVPGQSEVVLETTVDGAPMRKTIPVQIS